MSSPEDKTKERIQLFLRFRWVIIAALALLVSGEALLGTISPANTAAVFLALMAIALVDQFIKQYFERLEKDLVEAQKRTAGRLGKSLVEAQSAQSTAEESSRAMLHLMKDLKQSKDELEDRVRQRTLELEKANTFLESNVAARTTTLENSRKAILHMMKELKGDLTKLQAVDKMKNEFLSVVSHELRTPLTPIRGYANLLLSGQMGNLSKDQINAIEIIRSEEEQLLTLINSVLDISRLSAGKSLLIMKKPVLIKRLLEDINRAMAPQFASHRLGIEVSLPADFPAIEGDPNKLTQLLTNILGNALKFTPAQGQIKVKGCVRDNNVEIEIADNGIGIARENLEKIFDKFFQVDSSIRRSADGVGLGLAIAREIVEAHGGRIWAESEGVGRGTTIKFTLPIA